jgi:hypothetical protein
LSNRLREVCVLASLLTLVAAAASGQFGVPLNRTDGQLEPAKIREMVAQYCRMDYAGARLNPADWPKIQPAVAWRTNPEFTLFMVTARFDVNNEVGFERGKYSVDVRYRVLGKYDLAEGYSQDSTNRIEIAHFVVSEVNGEWRITEAEPNYPHPSKAAALQWISKKLTETSDPVAKTIYQHAQEGLQAQQSSPPAR